MSSNSNNNYNPDKIHHSDPIPIVSRLGRGRSLSVSSTSSGSSSAYEIPTPVSTSATSQRISIPSPTGSPILSYFLAQSPTKASVNATFPFKRGFAPPPVPEDEEVEKEIPVAAHMRRASVNVAGRFGQSQANTAIPDAQLERGSGFLRRLSLSTTTFTKPQNENRSPTMPPSPPPNSAVTLENRGVPFSVAKQRRATLNGEGTRPRRAPSPMGERMLKGHFDGFN
ncbi:hypothetical protein AMATHDRAFT_45766 [Amanita thiersii Skay4041]|uniref:Uncharacterized protein n=1 Tax=Amanita thiersii Skay4041 TaxID=703135 RepID=A0A2A9NUU9_9AGAR|nr:hypothetical protein AMATHDRAFT_45766 [Amanita thiersii Skay4041]